MCFTGQFRAARGGHCIADMLKRLRGVMEGGSSVSTPNWSTIFPRVTSPTRQLSTDCGWQELLSMLSAPKRQLALRRQYSSFSTKSGRVTLRWREKRECYWPRLTAYRET